jgi:hypothetical protein
LVAVSSALAEKRYAMMAWGGGERAVDSKASTRMGDMQDAKTQNHWDVHAGYQVLTTNTLTAKKEPRRMRARKYR